MVFTLGLRHTFDVWQRSLALVQSSVVQASFASFRAGVVKTFRWADEMFISATAKSELDFDAVVADLRRAFPESAMISDDYYATRLAGYVRIARETGMPRDCAPIRCLERNAAEHGVCRHLSVVVSDEIAFNTRIDKLGVLAVTEDSDDVSDAQPILAILRGYPLEIETS